MESDSESVLSVTAPETDSIAESSQSRSILSSKYSKDNANSLDFELPPIETSDIYIFKNELFTRVLLPINPLKPREMEVRCTM